jgi:hypothetical protein
MNGIAVSVSFDEGCGGAGVLIHDPTGYISYVTSNVFQHDDRPPTLVRIFPHYPHPRRNPLPNLPLLVSLRSLCP